MKKAFTGNSCQRKPDVNRNRQTSRHSSCATHIHSGTENCSFQLDNEIDYDAIDKKTVKLVMMICIPEAMKKEYMQVLGKISNFFQSEDNRSKLFSAENPDEMITILKGIEI